MKKDDIRVADETKTNGFSSFVDKYGYLIALILGAVAFGFLFAPLLSVTMKDESILHVSLITYFTNSFAYNWSMYLTLALLLSAIACAAIKKVHPYFMSASTFLFTLSVAMLALAKSFFTNNQNVDDVTIMWGLIIALICTSLAALISLSTSYSENQMSVRDIAEDGMLVAMAFVLNLLTLFKAPTGGSVNLQMLPLFLIALRHGPTHGLICGGIVYGLLTCATDGYGFACYPFDYLIGFGSVAILGFFRPLIFNGNTKYNFKSELFLLIGGIASTLVRFMGSTASSMVIWQTPFVESLIYNSVYIPVSGLIAIILIMLLYSPLAKLNEKFPIKHSYLL